MATESPVRILSGSGGISALGENLRSGGNPGSTREAQELSLLLRERSRLENMLNSRDLLMHRSESAPPTVEGSLAAMGGLFAHHPTSPATLERLSKAEATNTLESEQELRSDPAYLAYYYSHINLNPRLPPPLISWENWRLAQRLQTGVSIGNSGKDKKKLRSFDDSNSKSLFSSQPLLPTHREEPENLDDERSHIEHIVRQPSGEWPQGPDGLVGLGSVGLGRRKSLVDLIQEDFPRTPSPVYNHSRSSSRAANEDDIDAATVLDAQIAHLGEVAAALGSRSTTPNPVSVQLLGDTSSVTIAADHVAPGFSSISSTPNPSTFQMLGSSAGSSMSVARIPSPDLSNADARCNNLNHLGSTGGLSDSRLPSLDASNAMSVADVAATLHGLNIKTGEDRDQVQQSEQRQNDQAQYSHQPRLLQQHCEQFSQLGQTQASQNQPYAQSVQHQFSSDQGYKGQMKFGSSGITSQAQAHGINLQPGLQTGNTAPNMYAAAAAAAAMSYIAAGNPYYQNLHSTAMYAPQYGLGGYPLNTSILPPIMSGYPASGLPMTFDGAAAAAAVAANMRSRTPGSHGGFDLQQFYKLAGQEAGALPSAIQDALYLQYLQRAAEDARAAALSDTSLMRKYMTGTQSDALDSQKGPLAAAFGYNADQKSQFSRSGAVGIPVSSKSGSVSPVYYGSPPGMGLVLPYPNSPLASPVLPGSPVGPSGLSLRRDDRTLRLSSGAGRSGSGSYSTWHSQRSSDGGDETRGSFLLEEFKNSKNRRFELSDIAGHVVEFSADQHGSRFIQQKLETATSDEKTMVFQEVLPHAESLMSDVFGNYVIQKFFEHGSSQQRRELASQLSGRVLKLSLQMYGCRVIQKALEVVDVDQQTQLVLELDGNVMRCVRDQNGNHVIQKCIECVPPDRIEFIISAFYGQVVNLSTHPYGCRVIQRVLEHCTDEQKQRGIMEEILRSTCNLAQDQYGNYVVQHVLEHGNSAERSEIITKLAGQIVQMSQHKFASNVVEKCLEFGGPVERQILINEMLGHTDENEPLQAMMKDQFANYVVQKVLETCDDQQREILLNRIKVHLHALKKYTYGKHIVARVEKLVAAGERRSAGHHIV